MDGLLLQITSTGQALLGPVWPVVWNLVKILLVVLPLLGAWRTSPCGNAR
jgi:NADH-quinone oxidoreductase subunit H